MHRRSADLPVDVLSDDTSGEVPPCAWIVVQSRNAGSAAWHAGNACQRMGRPARGPDGGAGPGPASGRFSGALCQLTACRLDPNQIIMLIEASCPSLS